MSAVSVVIPKTSTVRPAFSPFNKMKTSACLAIAAIVTVFAATAVQAQNPCSAKKMLDMYNEMTRIGCKNCDKYFHCQANYDAVYKCSGILQETTAAAISNTREWVQGGGADSDADQVANRYGRGGGNCAAKYLKAYNCAYNPTTKQCKW